MSKALTAVFPKLELTGQAKAALDQADVERVRTLDGGSTLRIFVHLPKLVEHRTLAQAGMQIAKQCFPGRRIYVDIVGHFDTQGRPAAELYDSYRDSMLDELISGVNSDHLLYIGLSSASVEALSDARLLLTLPDKFAYREKESEFRLFLEQMFLERFGMEVSVEVTYRKNEAAGRSKDSMGGKLPALALTDSVSQQAYTAEQDVSTKSSNQGSPAKSSNQGSSAKSSKHSAESGTSHASGSYYKHADSHKSQKKIPKEGYLYGRGDLGQVITIAEIADEPGDEITVNGCIIASEDKPIRSGKHLLTFDLYDHTDSISFKLFAEPDEVDDLSSKLAVGTWVRLKGVTAYDRYDHELEISPVKAVIGIDDPTVRRMDTAAVKRVELHCHTQLSEMDAIASPADVVHRAYEWGHPAVAITDHGVVQGFTDAFHTWTQLWSDYAASCKQEGREADRADFFKIIYGTECYLIDDERDGLPEPLDYKKLHPYHCIILASNETGRVNLYRLISMSHLETFHKKPRMLKSKIRQYREGLIIGSACEAGELFRAILANKPDEEIERLVSFYDYLEIQPAANNHFMIASTKPEYESVHSPEDIREVNRAIVALGERYDKPVVATCDVHFLDPEDEIYRRVIQAGRGYPDADSQPPLYLRTTGEMLEEFEYLGTDKAYEVVVTNTNLIADRIESIDPVRPDKCPPKIPDSDKTLTEIVYDKAHKLYGETLPEIVQTRLDKELHSIISNGYSVMYIIAQKLVWKSNEDGYLVGSRGSVGSSLVAFMAGITEVNSLPAHYRCASCHYTDFDSEVVKRYATQGTAGCDLPRATCPHCGAPLIGDGFDIPFETFLGFDGDKEPDIDLNFSGEYQTQAHKYTEVIFGTGQTFKAGTVGTLADKTAYGYVKKYYEDRHESKRSCEINRIVRGCVGVKRTTGQHPGGIVVLPKGEDINTFTPVQHPAGDTESDVITTHFDYHAIDHNLLKLDILGHDDPTMLRRLQDLTGMDPQTVPLDDPEVMSLFQNTKALGIEPEDIGGCELGTLGVPEFGTPFAMGMLMDTKPEHLSDLVRIAGLAHGKMVWKGNVQDLILSGTATLQTAICCRDDIMIYLIDKGLEPGKSFKIMEAVRKGKRLRPEWEEEMTEHGVPQWYLDSCNKINYMFPKAHAAAYVVMAWRIAWFKVHEPLAYYAAYFAIRAKGFSYELMCNGLRQLELAISDYKARNGRDELTAKEKETYDDMLVVREMYARGFDFEPIDILRADAVHFQIIDGKIMPSLASIEGVGDKAAQSIADAVAAGGFLSKQDFGDKTGSNKTVMEALDHLGLLDFLPETDQMSLFG